MYEISVEKEFCAAHALSIAGTREPTHGHNFHLTVTIAGPALDQDGLLVDFHALESLVDAAIRPYINADLNHAPPFDRVSPTAERIAEHIGLRVAEGLPRLSLPRPRAPALRPAWPPFA